MEIRLFEKSDSKKVAKLLKNTVNIVETQGYAEKEVSSWPNDDVNLRDWDSYFLKEFTIVGEINKTIVSIAQIEDNGHISCFYCHPDFRRQGIGGKLYSALEDYARSKNISAIFTECSSTDLPFYQKMGFEITHKQKVLIRGEVPTHYIVKKDIS